MGGEGLNEGLNEGLKRLQDIESLQKIQFDGLDDKNRIHSLIRDDDLTITDDNFDDNFKANLKQTQSKLESSIEKSL